MKKFQFTLETLLNHRKRKEQTLQVEMSLIELDLINEKASLSKIKNDIIELHEKVRSNQTNIAEISEFAVYDNFITKLKNDILAKEEKIFSLENNLYSKRKELIEAIKERKVVDNLKDKKLSIHIEKYRKEEQDFMDEIGIYQFNKNNYTI